jgi:hypothetical protein
VPSSRRGHPAAVAAAGEGTRQQWQQQARAPGSSGSSRRGHPAAVAAAGEGTRQQWQQQARAPGSSGSSRRGHPAAVAAAGDINLPAAAGIAGVNCIADMEEMYAQVYNDQICSESLGHHSLPLPSCALASCHPLLQKPHSASSWLYRYEWA